MKWLIEAANPSQPSPAKSFQHCPKSRLLEVPIASERIGDSLPLHDEE
jgi:hypothetical protein